MIIFTFVVVAGGMILLQMDARDAPCKGSVCIIYAM